MRMLWLFLLGMLCGSAQAADAALMVRPTELKAKPFVDAATLASLPENQKVDVLLRDASWYQVKAAGAAGWVKMTSLRFPAATAVSGGSAVNANFLGAAIGSKRSTSTTGAKGLTKEDLQAAQPNPKALQTADTYVASKADAQQFAKSGKLSAQDIGYFGGEIK